MRVLHVGFGFRPWRFGGLVSYAEDLMDAQTAAGHSVGYFFTGRQYPWVRAPRVKRWARRDVQMYELLNPPPGFEGEAGTLYPERDLDRAVTDRLLDRALEDFRPDVVHVQELANGPSSLLEVPRGRGIPVVMTLQDYFPLCPTLKLYDSDGRICLRDEPGAQCARCCAHALDDAGFRASLTLGMDPLTRQYEEQRILRIGRVMRYAAAARMAALGALHRLRTRGRDPAPPPPLVEKTRDEPLGDADTAARYQRRRDVNVERLSRVDRLVAQSERVAEIYALLGVDAARISTMQFTLAHIERLRPRRMEGVRPPIRFVTMNGCASLPKGEGVVLDALGMLHERGLGDRFELHVLGYVGPEVQPRLRELPSVVLHGGYDPDRLDDLLDRYHVGIVPSVWEEAYGYVGPELLAKGLPIIGNALGGIVEYAIPGRTGWLNRDSSADGLARIMAEVIARPEEVERLNRSILDERDDLLMPMDRHAAAIEAVYREVVEAKRAATAGAVG